MIHGDGSIERDSKITTIRDRQIFQPDKRALDGDHRAAFLSSDMHTSRHTDKRERLVYHNIPSIDTLRESDGSIRRCSVYSLLQRIAPSPQRETKKQKHLNHFHNMLLYWYFSNVLLWALGRSGVGLVGCGCYRTNGAIAYNKV